MGYDSTPMRSLWFRWTPNHPMRTTAALEYWPLITVYATTNQRDITTGKRRARRTPTMQVERCYCCYCSNFVLCVGYFSATVLFVCVVVVGSVFIFVSRPKRLARGSDATMWRDPLITHTARPQPKLGRSRVTSSILSLTPIPSKFKLTSSYASVTYVVMNL